MKPNRFLVPLGLLLYLVLCMVPTGNAQTCAPVSDPGSASWQVGLKCNFTSASSPYQFSASSITYWQVFFVPSGTVSSGSLSLDSSATGGTGNFSTGGIVAAGTIGSIASAGSYANSSATTPTNYGQLTPTITGTGTVTVVVFGYRNNPATSSGGGGGNVTVTNFPSTQNVAGTVTANQGSPPWSENISQLGGQSISLYALLFNNVAATATQTSSAIRLPNYSAQGTVWISGASITGSPSGCQIVIELQGSNGAPASAAIQTIAFTPGNSFQGFALNPASPNANGDTAIGVFSCGTYPTGGTISAGISPGVRVSIADGAGNAATSNSTTQSRSIDVNLVSVLGVTHAATDPLFTQGIPASSAGPALSASSQSALTTAVVVKASSGNLFGLQVTNGAASACYLEFINAASAPTLGTNAVYSFQVPASSTLTLAPGSYPLSNFATGVSVGMATTYNGASACGTAATAVIFYK